MTVGAYTIGSLSSPIYATKSWSGGNGRLTENGYTMQSTRCERAVDTTYDQFHVPTGSGYYNSTEGWNLATLSWRDANYDISLINKLSDQIRGHSFNAAVFSAELPEALGMLKNSFRAFYGMTHSIMRGDLVSAIRSLSAVAGQRDPLRPRREPSLQRGKLVKLERRLAAVRFKNIPDAFLAMQYGWKPLFQDVFELAKSVDAVTKPGVRKLVFREHIGERWTEAAANLVPYFGGKVTHVNRLSYKLILRELPSVADDFGLTDPAPVIWEKIPYTVVVDWFIPVGNFLSARSFVSSLSSKLVVRSDFRSFSVSCPPGEIGVPVSGPPYNGYWKAGGNSYRTVSFNRTVGSTLDVPRPSLKTIERAFSTVHLANAGALLSSRVFR